MYEFSFNYNHKFLIILIIQNIQKLRSNTKKLIQKNLKDF